MDSSKIKYISKHVPVPETRKSHALLLYSSPLIVIMRSCITLCVHSNDYSGSDEEQG